MPDLTYIHSLQLRVGKVQAPQNLLTQVDFQIDPPEILNLNDYNEDLEHRFNLAAATVDYPFPMGTVATAKLLIVRPEGDLTLKIINAAGTSQALVFPANRTSILHMVFTGLLASNPAITAIKGVIFLAGD